MCKANRSGQSHGARERERRKGKHGNTMVEIHCCLSRRETAPKYLGVRVGLDLVSPGGTKRGGRVIPVPRYATRCEMHLAVGEEKAGCRAEPDVWRPIRVTAVLLHKPFAAFSPVFSPPSRGHLSSCPKPCPLGRCCGADQTRSGLAWALESLTKLIAHCLRGRRHGADGGWYRILPMEYIIGISAWDTRLGFFLFDYFETLSPPRRFVTHLRDTEDALPTA